MQSTFIHSSIGLIFNKTELSQFTSEWSRFRWTQSVVRLFEQLSHTILSRLARDVFFVECFKMGTFCSQFQSLNSPIYSALHQTNHSFCDLFFNIQWMPKLGWTDLGYSLSTTTDIPKKKSIQTAHFQMTTTNRYFRLTTTNSMKSKIFDWLHSLSAVHLRCNRKSIFLVRRCTQFCK